MTNKEKILEYCKNYKSDDIYSLMVRDDIVIGLSGENKKMYLLSGCPTSWGLEDFLGICYNKDVIVDSDSLCMECWDRVLNK